MTLQELGAVRRALDAGELDERLAQLRYGETEKARAKVRNVLEGFERSFGADDKRPVALCSAPGRTEICGNHTDHQHGRVLAGAVDLDFLACAAKNGTNRISVSLWSGGKGHSLRPAVGRAGPTMCATLGLVPAWACQI